MLQIRTRHESNRFGLDFIQLQAPPSPSRYYGPLRYPGNATPTAWRCNGPDSKEQPLCIGAGQETTASATAWHPLMICCIGFSVHPFTFIRCSIPVIIS
mmetsp:Transcript_154769/g.496130  ORF Transcript_154769/g.496130 Transcript_154769/m.496130 type:complete len:99 (+) Transcript_154769:282-578(+)